MAHPEQSFYDAVGGAGTFRRIVARFYEQVAEDEILRPLYPEQDLTGAEDRLRMFLEQYWGGPRTYSDQRGHPPSGVARLPGDGGRFDDELALLNFPAPSAQPGTPQRPDAVRR